MKLNNFAYSYSKPLRNHTLKIMKIIPGNLLKNLEISWKYHGILSARKSGNPGLLRVASLFVSGIAGNGSNIQNIRPKTTLVTFSETQLLNLFRERYHVQVLRGEQNSFQQFFQNFVWFSTLETQHVCFLCRS